MVKDCSLPERCGPAEGAVERAGKRAAAMTEPAIETGVLAAAGQALEFARVPGRRPGPALVLLHEGLGCVALWRDFPARLGVATGLPVFSYSRAGYGASDPIVLPRPLDFHTREALQVLPAVLDAAGIDDCLLIGHSDGASIAIIHAGRARDPRVRALALLAPHVLTEEKTLANIRAALTAYEHADLRERLARHHGGNVDNAFRGWADCWLDPGFRNWNIESALAAIAVPVMTIRGNDDPYSTVVHVERIAAGVAGPVTTVALADCGHAPQADQADSCLAALARYVQQVEADCAS